MNTRRNRGFHNQRHRGERNPQVRGTAAGRYKQAFEDFFAKRIGLAQLASQLGLPQQKAREMAIEACRRTGHDPADYDLVKRDEKAKPKGKRKSFTWWLSWIVLAPLWSAANDEDTSET